MTPELAFIEKLVSKDFPDYYDMLIVKHNIKKIRKLTRDPVVLARIAEIERAQELLEYSQQEYDRIMRSRYNGYTGYDRVEALRELEVELAPELHWYKGIANLYERVQCAIEVFSQ